MPCSDKLLIVDDEPRMCESLKDLLSTQGYEIKTSCNGYDALQCLAEDPFTLVLLDIVMEQMDGFQVMERMESQNLDIPVIIMTGYASTASAVQAFRKGAYDYLRKPFEPDELYTSVKNALNQRRRKKDNDQLNRKLRESEERFRRLAENARDMIYRMSLPDGHYEYVSPASIDLFGYTPKEFYESPVLIKNIIHPTWAEYFKEQWANLLSCNMPPFYEYQIIHKSGEERWVHQRNFLIRDNNGQPKAIEGVVSDITERKEAEAALRKSDEKHRLLFENAGDAIYIHDSEARIIAVNSTACNQLGYTQAKLLSMTVAEVDAPEEAQHSPKRIVRLMEQGNITFETMHRRKDGTIFPVDVNAQQISWEGQSVAMSICRDITDRKQSEKERAELEAQNRQLQKSESLSRMAGAIAHHFNNQLQAVIGYIDLATNELPMASSPAEFLTNAIKASHRAAEVSGLMLTYLGQTTAKKEPIDISEVCRRSLPLFRATLPETIRLETDLPSPGPTINANANQIQQVLINLITNAGESVADDQGIIHLSVKTVSFEIIPKSHRYPIDWQPQDAAYACLEIKDTGSGIAEKDIDKIFDPFFTSKFTGRGLGLPVVLGVVRAHRGLISVESETGRGSIFRVFLPVIADAVIRPLEKTIIAPVVEGRGTVLIAEDIESVRKMARTMLTRLGFTVFGARDGIEAVEIFRRHSNEIRCVLCDLTMPRMNGWETLTALRNLSPNLPVILVSGHDEGQGMAGDYPGRPDAFLYKPFSRKELAGVMQQVLAKK